MKLKAPFFLFLLPIFFVLHGFMENYNFVPVKDALLLTALYIGCSLLFVLPAWLLFRDFTKAALVGIYIMSFHFFFGSMHDLLKRLFPGSLLSKYSFVIGGAFVVLLVLIIILKRRKQPVTRMAYYLNVLFLVLILIDLVQLTGKMIASKKKEPVLPEGMVSCTDCPRPDIYFIIADEYIGNSTLLEKFGFNNSSFTNQLSDMGFHTIPYSRSNYNYTPFSVASTLDMEYLQLHTGNMHDRPDITLCYQTIRDNKLLRFLQYQHYRFYNYSIFDFEGQPASVELSFLPVKTKLITSQTFLSRFNRDIRFNLVTRLRSENELKRQVYSVMQNNEHNYNSTMQIAGTPGNSPKFIFTHLHLPHYPYFFDRNGKEQPFEKLTEGNQVNKEMYIGYLQYSNKKYLELISEIIKKSQRPPVIILMGDHGFRHFAPGTENKYFFLNHLSLLLPDKNYTRFSDSLTNVNFFRVFLNTQFRQQLPLLPDSTYLIQE